MNTCRKLMLDNTSFAIVNANDTYLIEYDLVSNDGTDTIEGRVLFDGESNNLTIRGDKTLWDVVNFRGYNRLRFNCPDGKFLNGRVILGSSMEWATCSASDGEVVIPDDAKHESSTGGGAGTARVQYVTAPPPAGTDPQVISILLET